MLQLWNFMKCKQYKSNPEDRLLRHLENLTWKIIERNTHQFSSLCKWPLHNDLNRWDKETSLPRVSDSFWTLHRLLSFKQDVFISFFFPMFYAYFLSYFQDCHLIFTLGLLKLQGGVSQKKLDVFGSVWHQSTIKSRNGSDDIKKTCLWTNGLMFHVK